MRKSSRSVNVDQNEFAAAANADDARASQFSIERRLCFARNELWQEDFSGNYSAANDDAAQGAHNMLDFRKLRHRRKFEVRLDPQSTARTPPRCTI